MPEEKNEQEPLQLSEAKSQEIADIIVMMQVPIMMLGMELDYIKLLSSSMYNQASRQESMAVLNPSHPQSKNELLRLQAQALKQLGDYIGTLKEIDKKKIEIAGAEKSMQEIHSLFI